MRIQHVGAASNADPATPTGAEAGRAEDAARLQIGEWTVEPSLNQISAAGSVVKLEPKAMAVLMHLASRPGQVVSRESLLSAVWSGVVVGDVPPNSAAAAACNNNSLKGSSIAAMGNAHRKCPGILTA